MRVWIVSFVTVALLAACEPEYSDGAVHDDEGAHHEVAGGADPTAVSRNAADTSVTIHHPGADGNAGRPPDDSASQVTAPDASHGDH